MGAPLTLAFDTADSHIALALLMGDRVLAEQQVHAPKTQGEQVFGLINAALGAHGLKFSDLHCIGVGVGPGSFSGIRLAVAAARGLAMGRAIPAVGVSTLQALAHGQTAPCMVALYARRDQLYVQYFNTAQAGQGPGLITRTALTQQLKKRANIHLIGPLAAQIQKQTGTGARVCAPAYPLAVAIARIAYVQRNAHPPPPAPLYLRPANADLPNSPPLKILP